MKLKKTLLAGATAATVAFAGVGVASAQEGSSDLPTGSISQSAEEGSGEGSSTSEITGSLNDLFGDEGILGSFAPGDDTTWIDGIGGITAVISLIAAAIGLGGLLT